MHLLPDIIHTAAWFAAGFVIALLYLREDW